MGQSGPGQMKSLRAYALRILICKAEGVSVGGSGHQLLGESKYCIVIHKDPDRLAKGLSYWENYNGDNAKADDAKFVNVMDQKDLVKLQNIKTELAPPAPPRR